jgi:hypothetical protein
LDALAKLTRMEVDINHDHEIWSALDDLGTIQHSVAGILLGRCLRDAIWVDEKGEQQSSDRRDRPKNV